MVNIKRRGLMLVLSSPSGAGKTTIARALLTLDKNLISSISVTTRPKRPEEVDGVDYHFISKVRFDEMVENQELLEHAHVFGNYYGTPKAPVLSALEQGKDIIFDIDWQGTQQLAQHAQQDLVRVFILPPTFQSLEDRLRSRAQDNEEIIKVRMHSALSEVSHWAEYNYVFVNERLEQSVNYVQGILNSERLKRRRQIGLADFVKTLYEGVVN